MNEIEQAIAGFETDNALLAGSREVGTIERNKLAIAALREQAERSKGCVRCKSDNKVTHNGEHFNVTTNADRIRSMSDEELHKFLLDFEAGDIDYAKTFCDLCCKDAALERKSTDCEGCLLWWLKNDATLPQGIDWLKQPVKEE